MIVLLSLRFQSYTLHNSLLTFLNGDDCGKVVTDECVITYGGVQGDKVSLVELK